MKSLIIIRCLASVSFLNVGKKLGLFKKGQCNHTKLLSTFFGSSCVPGASDPSHGVGQTKANLCSLCPHIGSGATSPVRPSTGPTFITTGMNEVLFEVKKSIVY